MVCNAAGYAKAGRRIFAQGRSAGRIRLFCPHGDGLGVYVSALEMLERIEDPDDQSEALRAACLAQLGRDSEARRAATRAVEMGGDFLQRQEWLTLWPFKYPADREHFLDGLLKSEVLGN